VKRLAGAAVGEVLAARAGGWDGVPVGTTRRGNFALAVVNAAVGDRLAERRSPLGIRMALRVSGRDVPAEPEDLSVAFPRAAARLAVFVHGLGGTEGTWLFAARRHYDDPAMCYGSKLADEFGYTALYSSLQHRVARVRERTVVQRSAQCRRGELADGGG
jgi:hypothetical protein